MEPARTAILRLYDYLATQIMLDFTSATPHILGCNGTLRHASVWIATADSSQQAAWRVWFRAMCIDCDCGLLLQLNTMAAENGALEGINMRRCSSCNGLLALYQVIGAAPANQAELLVWAAEADVPAYVVTLIGRNTSHAATITKVYPPGATFTLTDKQFFGSVLRQIEQQHRCLHP